MRLFDEQSGELRDVRLHPRIGVYVCGITPYDSAHLGHAFTYVHFDVLVRYLRHLGCDVVHVQNVTDVDDDILRTAKERGVDYLELAEAETQAFERDMRAIGVVPPTHSPRATQFVPEMIEEVAALLAGGHAYRRGGNVYFDVASDPRYGTLSGLERGPMLELAAERGGRTDDPSKKDPLDFVLWQRSEPGEPEWESPWGRGRPGWHIECSTMARRLIGTPIDVHGGGSDLVFPHHESERAQAESIPGGAPFVLHWMHTATVAMDGEKMSKSLGNLVFVRDLLVRHGGAAVRSYLLRRHYRDEWTFEEDDLRAELEPRNIAEGPVDRESFYSALEDDLDTPTAMQILDRAATRGTPEDRALVAEGRALLGLDLETHAPAAIAS